MGAAWQIDPATKVKARLESDGVVALAYVQRVREAGTLTIASGFRLAEGVDADVKVGVSLAVE